MNTIKGCIEGVALFNDIGGNLSNVNREKLIAQAKVVKEEGLELVEAVLGGNNEEILKECIDCMVTVVGMFKMLEQQGYDTMGAWLETNQNNMSKFTTSLIDVDDSIAHYYNKGVIVKAEYNDFYDVYVLKDECGKIRKPLSYKKCSVACYTPKGIPPVMDVPPVEGSL